MEELNPYEAPQTQVPQGDADAILLRSKCLRAEFYLKTVGLFITALSLAVITIKAFIWKVAPREIAETAVPWPEIVFEGLPFVAGLGLCFLKRWAGMLAGTLTILSIVVNVEDLPDSWVEIIFHGVILGFLFSAGGRRVLSRDYQDVIKRTPMVEIPATAWIWPVIVLCALFFAVLFVLR